MELGIKFINKRLESLYDAKPSEKRFRHFYTDIFSVLTQVQQNSQLGDINILGQNLDVIRNGYNPQNKASDGIRIIDVSDVINKLYDHVNLDIARITYSDAADRRISGKEAVEDLQAQINSLQIELQKAQSIQKDYEIVYRTVFISLVIGFILINILYGLFYYINSIVNKQKSISPMIISNIVVLVLLIFTVFKMLSRILLSASFVKVSVAALFPPVFRSGWVLTVYCLIKKRYNGGVVL